MKIRIGFVSNSSSSSFYVAVKTDDIKVTHKGLLELLGIPMGSQGAKFFATIINEIVDGEEYEYEQPEDESLERFKVQLASSKKQLADCQADYRKETDLTTKYARALLSNITRLKQEVSELETYVGEVKEAYQDEGPFPELRNQPGWKILEVTTDETEGIGSLECDVVKVQWR